MNNVVVSRNAFYRTVVGSENFERKEGDMSDHLRMEINLRVGMRFED